MSTEPVPIARKTDQYHTMIAGQGFRTRANGPIRSAGFRARLAAECPGNVRFADRFAATAHTLQVAPTPKTGLAPLRPHLRRHRKPNPQIVLSQSRH